jgi:hypothetical protein
MNPKYGPDEASALIESKPLLTLILLKGWHRKARDSSVWKRWKAQVLSLSGAGLAAALLGSTASAADTTTNLILSGNSQNVTPAGDELQWPREFQHNGVKVDIYQPQIEKWEGADFETRSVVAITAPGSNAPLYGVFWMKARANVDKSARVVTLENTEVTKATFPSNPALQDQYLALIRTHVPTVTKMIALDHLEADYAISEAVKKAEVVAVKNDVPRIFYSSRPALLVLVDGPPALRAVPGFDVQRVINSAALILKDGPAYYLSALGGWYETVEVLDGEWSLSLDPPPVLDQIKQAVTATNSLDPMTSSTAAATNTPVIFVSTVPAELIQTEGQPNLVPIEGTQLMQVQNSDNGLFFYEPNQEFYVLLSGRWFTSSSLHDGTWAFVPYKELPKDFAKIPPTHPKANVLVSVPGTPQANEAVIANSIPQTATVNRQEAKLELTYDGAPQFKPIAGTPLLYAINTATPVIEVDAHNYYSVQNGVWFVAASPTGPWAVATRVPPVIYTIPASSPLHYVVYAQVYGATPDEVYVGYTPGYLGTEVGPDNVVVYGTGYYYPPYIGNDWVGWPCTYGFGVGFADNWGTGFGFGFGAGEWVGTWCHPWWGPCGWGWRHHRYDYDRVSLNHINIYHHWGPGIVHVEHGYGFNAWNGREWSHNWGTHFNPYSSRPVEHRGQTVRAYEGNFEAHVARSPIAPRIIEQHSVYSGRDGNVYRYNPSGSVERSTGGAWHPASPPPQIQQHAFSQSIGEQRFNNFRSMGGGFAHGGGAMAHVGGGGHR